MSQSDGQLGELAWLLDDLAGRVPEVRSAVVLSDDGLLMAASQGLEQGKAEQLAAAAAGYQSLSRGVGGMFGSDTVRQTIIEMNSLFLFVTAAGPRACLAVISTARSDVGQIAYEIARLVHQVGAALSTSERRG